jgi:ABC-type nitrate/sulfonate/bicarbonate transport system ATPase subunit
VTDIALHFEAITFGYPGSNGARHQTFFDFSLALERGRTVAVLGPSGAGKTTLIRIACAELVPTAGAVRLAPDLKEPGAISPCHQDASDGTWPWLTVRQNLAQPMKAKGLPADLIEKRTGALLDRFGLRGVAHQYPSTLSGGQHSRLSLGRSLASQAPVLLADEPFGPLDQVTKRSVIGGLREEFDEFPRTALVITHALTDALAVADRVILLRVDEDRRCVIAADEPLSQVYPRIPGTAAYESAMDRLLKAMRAHNLV